MAKKPEVNPTNYDWLAEYGPTGKNMVKLGSQLANRKIVSSGILTVDLLTGRGGFLSGRMVNIVGDPNTGKTTTCLRTAAWAAVNYNWTTLYIDTEGRHEEEIAVLNGVDVDDRDKFWLVQWEPPDPRLTDDQKKDYESATLNNLTEAVEKFCNDKRVLDNGGGIVIIDSLNALMTDEKEAIRPGEKMQGLGIPKIMSQWSPALINFLRARNVLMLVTYQYRARIATGPMAKYGPQTSVSGGWAVRYYNSMFLEYKKASDVSEGEKEDRAKTGIWVRVTSLKNTGGRWYQTGLYQMTNDAGPNDAYEILNHGQQYGLVEKSGSWYTLKLPEGDQRMQGEAKVLDTLNADPLLIAVLREEIRSRAMTGIIPQAVVVESVVEAPAEEAY